MIEGLLGDSLKTLIGFFLALLLNRLIDIFWRDPKQQRQILRAIKLEALTNCNICMESFKPFYKGGLVLNQYSTETIEKNITDPKFIINTSTNDLNVLIRYLRFINMCNRYPEFVRNIRLSHDKIIEQEWLGTATNKWGEYIKKSASSISEVLDLSKEADKEINELLKKDKLTYENYSALLDFIK